VFSLDRATSRTGPTTGNKDDTNQQQPGKSAPGNRAVRSRSKAQTAGFVKKRQNVTKPLQPAKRRRGSNSVAAKPTLLAGANSKPTSVCSTPKRKRSDLSLQCSHCDIISSSLNSDKTPACVCQLSKRIKAVEIEVDFEKAEQVDPFDALVANKEHHLYCKSPTAMNLSAQARLPLLFNPESTAAAALIMFSWKTAKHRSTKTS